MNIAIWLLAGAFLGWAAYSYLNLNLERGVKISVAIGAAGGLIGGKVLAPMFLAPVAVPADFSTPALFIAAVAAAAFLFAGNLVYSRWGV
jgi:uncharacterized membrane protein YeaQ/YmgE (transglycosylase-associated protein family)